MKKIIFALLIITASTARAVEETELISPLIVDPRFTTLLRVHSMLLDYTGKQIVIVVGDGGLIRRTFSYWGDEAISLMNTLNKANLSTNSLHRRIMNKLIADGHIDGTIIGQPD